MKKICLVLTAAAFVLLPGCSKDNADKNTKTYTIYSPVYQSKAAVLAAINGAPSTAIEHAGKLFIKGDYIYLNDVNKGIHIIDNSNATHPFQVAFLSIPGNLDIAIKGNILYADMYNDLLALDITNPHHTKIISTLKNFFTERAYVNGYVANDDSQIAVNWLTKDTTIIINNETYPPCNPCALFTNSGTVPSAAQSQSGTAGSMAAMILVNNYLYAISERHTLGIVDVSNATAPKLDSSFFAGYDLETIYYFEDKLFLGSAIGTFMYDISNPQQPVSIGEFTHGRACDPVIADGNYAYVTLHAGTECGGDANELDVVDIQDIKNSTLAKSYNLLKPTGLAKDGNLLFVCDSVNVKVYDATNPSQLKLIQQLKSNDPYDVIAINKKLIVVTADGLNEYDYSNIDRIGILSFIAAKE